MRLKIASLMFGFCLVVVPTAAASAGAHSDRLSWGARLLAQQVLPANDGWAAEGPGTTGGSAATPDQVFVVHNRPELVAALGGDNATNATNSTPKIVLVDGVVNGNADDNNRPLPCSAYADPGYSLDAFLAAYDPAVWGRTTKPSGPLEDARARSAKNQAARTMINVGSNTTIIGLRGAWITEANLMVSKVDNVIMRNLRFSDARDCFPVWDPTDGATGNWNSAYDNASIIGSTHVWFDHNTFTDAGNPDSNQPVYFGRPFQVHDGELDITKAADLVTASFNVFTNHDKTMLIGSTNTPGADVGKLRVTLHHNLYDGVGQRAPRVRFGQVDVYNNLYRVPSADNYSYSWGVGVQSAIYAENNFFCVGGDVTPDSLIFNWGGTAITEKGTWIRTGQQPAQPADVAVAFNAAHDPDFGLDAGWTPALRASQPLPTQLVPFAVGLLAGAGRLPT
jgi:pectate lyase